MYSTNEKLKNSATTADSSFIDPAIQMANNESHMTLKRYPHQIPPPVPLYPTKTNLIKFIRNNQLPTWLGLTSQVVENHLQDSAPAT